MRKWRARRSNEKPKKLHANYFRHFSKKNCCYTKEKQVKLYQISWFFSPIELGVGYKRVEEKQITIHEHPGGCTLNLRGNRSLVAPQFPCVSIARETHECMRNYFARVNAQVIARVARTPTALTLKRSGN